VSLLYRFIGAWVGALLLLGAPLVGHASEREVQVSVAAALLQQHGVQHGGPGSVVQLGLAYDPSDWLGFGCRLQASYFATVEAALPNALHQRLLFASRAITFMPYFALKPPAQQWASGLSDWLLAELQLGLKLGCRYDSGRVHLYRESFVNRHAPAWRAELQPWVNVGLAVKISDRWACGVQAGMGTPLLAEDAWQRSVGLQLTYAFYR
jgi:hypothetical protein